eukprot:1366206-Amphidinium_carterae.1
MESCWRETCIIFHTACIFSTVTCQLACLLKNQRQCTALAMHVLCSDTTDSARTFESRGKDQELLKALPRLRLEHILAHHKLCFLQRAFTSNM